MATVQQAKDTTITTVATLDSTEESLQQPIVLEAGARKYYQKILNVLLEEQVRGVNIKYKIRDVLSEQDVLLGDLSETIFWPSG